jgi:outer membrane biosynthesis protein TonB
LEHPLIPTLVKLPLHLTQQLAVVVLRTGVGVATGVLHRVLPGGGGAHDEPSKRPEAPAPAPTDVAPVVDITPPKPTVVADPVTQPPTPDPEPTPGATTTLADPAPATANPATRSTAKRATARRGPAKKATPKKPAAGATKAKKAVDKKTPAPKAKPTKPASVLDEPAAPVDDDPVVYSTGPE